MRAAVSKPRDTVSVMKGLDGLTSRAITFAVGTTCRSSSSRFGSSSVFKLVTAVALPPGRTGDKSRRYWVAPDLKDDRDGCCRGLRRYRRRRTPECNNHSHLTANQIGR